MKAKAKGKRMRKRDLFAELSESINALSEARQADTAHARGVAGI